MLRKDTANKIMTFSKLSISLFLSKLVSNYHYYVTPVTPNRIIQNTIWRMNIVKAAKFFKKINVIKLAPHRKVETMRRKGSRWHHDFPLMLPTPPPGRPC